MEGSFCGTAETQKGKNISLNLSTAIQITLLIVSTHKMPSLSGGTNREPSWHLSAIAHYQVTLERISESRWCPCQSSRVIVGAGESRPNSCEPSLRHLLHQQVTSLGFSKYNTNKKTALNSLENLKPTENKMLILCFFSQSNSTSIKYYPQNLQRFKVLQRKTLSL